MPKRGTPPIQGDMLQGTLDVLVLKTLALGPAHGHTIAHAIENCIEIRFEESGLNTWNELLHSFGLNAAILVLLILRCVDPVVPRRRGQQQRI